MEAGAWGFIGAISGAIVGAGASVLTSVINSRNAARMQHSANSLERAERARAFQRETLVNLQEGLQDLMRLVTRAHLADLAANRNTGGWGKNMLPDDLSEEIRISNRNLAILLERIADDELRDDIKQLHGNINSVHTAKTKESAEARHMALAPLFQKSMEHLGAVLRQNY